MTTGKKKEERKGKRKKKELLVVYCTHEFVGGGPHDGEGSHLFYQ